MYGLNLFLQQVDIVKCQKYHRMYHMLISNGQRLSYLPSDACQLYV